MGETAFITEDFDGAIILKDWMRWHDGRSYIGFAGKVSVVQDEQLVGFRAKGNESNWVAIIAGPTERVVILGCQIRGCHVAASNPSTEWLIVP